MRSYGFMLRMIISYDVNKFLVIHEGCQDIMLEIMMKFIIQRLDQHISLTIISQIKLKKKACY
jgi:hypothetical protein